MHAIVGSWPKQISFELDWTIHIGAIPKPQDGGAGVSLCGSDKAGVEKV